MILLFCRVFKGFPQCQLRFQQMLTVRLDIFRAHREEALMWVILQLQHTLQQHLPFKYQLVRQVVTTWHQQHLLVQGQLLVMGKNVQNRTVTVWLAFRINNSIKCQLCYLENSIMIIIACFYRNILATKINPIYHFWDKK